jgi:hypothetical protein
VGYRFYYGTHEVTGCVYCRDDAKLVDVFKAMHKEKENGKLIYDGKYLYNRGFLLNFFNFQAWPHDAEMLPNICKELFAELTTPLSVLMLSPT